MDKTKLHIKMTTKGLSQKQVIIPIGKANIEFINRALKNIKSNVMVDYVQPEVIGVTIVTNFIASVSDF